MLQVMGDEAHTTLTRWLSIKRIDPECLWALSRLFWKRFLYAAHES